MKVSSRKNKGRRLGLEIKQILHKHAPNLQNDDIRVTPSGVPGVDIQLSPEAKRIYPVSIENKNQENISIWACIEQTETNTESGTVPVLCFKRNNSKTYAVIEADILFKLMSLL